MQMLLFGLKCILKHFLTNVFVKKKEKRKAQYESNVIVEASPQIYKVTSIYRGET